MSFGAVVDPDVQNEVASVEEQVRTNNSDPLRTESLVQATDESVVADWLSLSLLPGCGAASVRKLIEHFGSPGAVLRATSLQWAEVEGLGAKQLATYAAIGAARKQASQVLETARSAGIQLLTVEDSAYPELLQEIPDPPAVLYCLGDLRLLQSTCVAMVGSRSATSYGRRVARSFAGTLSGEALTIVSGMALGIDSESHIGALQAGGNTVGVLGCGIDVVYPRQNMTLYEQVKRNGLLISEYPPGVRPEGFRFPARNRIIAGLSRGVVVVEAARKSGSLITAQLGLDFGREIFAVPGQIDSYKSEGAHWLLQQGAQLVMTPADILAGISAPYEVDAAGKGSERASDVAGAVLPSGLEPDAVQLLALLEPYPVSREEISMKVDLSQARLSELFLYLELEGVVEMGPGDMVRRTV